jgi:hypothetical protein
VCACNLVTPRFSAAVRATALAAWRIGGDAPRLVAGEQLARRPSSRFVLAIDEGQRLLGGVAHDEARNGFLDGHGGGSGERKARSDDSGTTHQRSRQRDSHRRLGR